MKKYERQRINLIFRDLLEEAYTIQNELVNHDCYSSEFKTLVSQLNICNAKLEVILLVMRRLDI